MDENELAKSIVDEIIEETELVDGRNSENESGHYPKSDSSSEMPVEL